MGQRRCFVIRNFLNNGLFAEDEFICNWKICKIIFSLFVFNLRWAWLETEFRSYLGQIGRNKVLPIKYMFKFVKRVKFRSALANRHSMMPDSFFLRLFESGRCGWPVTIILICVSVTYSYMYASNIYNVGTIIHCLLFSISSQYIYIYFFSQCLKMINHY